MKTRRTWTSLWRDLTAVPEFYRERRGQPLELALAVAEPALSVALVTTLVSGIAAFIGALAPFVRLDGLPAMAALTAIIAYFYGHRLEWSGIILREWIVLLVPLIVLWRLVTLLTLGSSLSGTLGAWLAHPSSVFDAAFTIGGALLVLAWSQGFFYGRTLAALHPVAGEEPPRPEPGSALYWRADEDRRARYLPPPSNLVAHWLQGGLVLAMVSAIGALGTSTVFSTRALLRLATFGAPDESAALPNVLAYMLCGLVLVGLAQLSRLRANWISDGVVVMPGLPRRALGALAAAALVALGAALLLPTRYAVGLGDLLATLAYGVHLVASVILAAIMTIILAPLAALLDLLLGHHSAHVSPGPMRPPPPAPDAQHGIGLGAFLQSLLFWGIALAVLAYCVAMLWRQGRLPMPAAGRLRWIAGLALTPLRWLAAVLRGGLRRGIAGAALMARYLSREARAQRTVPRPGRLSWRHAGPRERVAYLYLSIEARARRLGLPRGSGQTASAYSRQLSRRMPDLDPDLGGLTSLFLEARYSPHDFDEARVVRARGLWSRVRARLRARRLVRH